MHYLVYNPVSLNIKQFWTTSNTTDIWCYSYIYFQFVQHFSMLLSEKYSQYFCTTYSMRIVVIFIACHSIYNGFYFSLLYFNIFTYKCTCDGSNNRIFVAFVLQCVMLARLTRRRRSTTKYKNKKQNFMQAQLLLAGEACRQKIQIESHTWLDWAETDADKLTAHWQRCRCRCEMKWSGVASRVCSQKLRTANIFGFLLQFCKFFIFLAISIS